MKKSLVLFFFFLLSYGAYSQELLSETDDVYAADVIQPKFNGGGLDKFYDFINKEFDFTKVTKPGKMVVAFSVDVTGEIKNIRVVQYIEIEAASEIIRILQQSPKWESAKRNGKPFSVEIKLPLEFKK